MAEYDVAIIGGGPGGYVAAIRAAQLGLKAAIIEKERVGGLCLHWGCVPSKALLRAAEVANLARRGPEFGVTYADLTLNIAPAVRRSRALVAQMAEGIETLLERNKVAVIYGSARLATAQVVWVEPDGKTVEANNVIIATGASPKALPNVQIDGERVITSRHALALTTLPESLAIIGGGAIGVELAYYFRSFGADVTIVERLPHLLPLEDEEVSRQLERSFRGQGVDLRLGTELKGIEVVADGVCVDLEAGGVSVQFYAEKVLIAVGLEANASGLGLEELGVATDNGWVAVDGYCRTNLPGVWAIGDVTGKLPLAHVASQQGVTAVETIAGFARSPMDYASMPRAVYCQPQVASVGLTEAAARQLGFSPSIGRFPFRASGKAMAVGESEGFVKLVTDEATGTILGVHMIGQDSTELLGEASLASALQATAGQLAGTVHAHPTLSETLKEAALAVSGESIHLFLLRRRVR